MNESAILIASYVFEVAFLFSLIIAALVGRSAMRTRRAAREKARHQAYSGLRYTTINDDRH